MEKCKNIQVCLCSNNNNCICYIVFIYYLQQNNFSFKQNFIRESPFSSRLGFKSNRLRQVNKKAGSKPEKALRQFFIRE